MPMLFARGTQCLRRKEESSITQQTIQEKETYALAPKTTLIIVIRVRNCGLEKDEEGALVPLERIFSFSPALCL